MPSAPSNFTNLMPPLMPLNVNLLAEPQLLGAFLAWGLQGVLTLQCYMYYTLFPQDRRVLKIFVWATFIWKWVQIGLVTQSYFEIYVYDYGSLQSMTSYHNTWFSAPVMTSVVSFMVQCFFSWRIWNLSRFKVLTCVILFLSFAQMTLGIAGGIILVVSHPDAAHASLNRIVVSFAVMTATVVDTIIASSMSYLLLRAKSGIKQSDKMVHKLVRLVIETGSMTAIVALVDGVMMMTQPNNLLFECPALILPKLYSNSLLVSLNNRAFINSPSEVRLPSFVGQVGGLDSAPETHGQNRTQVGVDGESTAEAHVVPIL